MGRYINKKASKWLRALESGNFKQTRDSLFNKIDNKSYGYCCLGVACQINGFTKDKTAYESGMTAPKHIKLEKPFIGITEVPNKFFETEFNFKQGTTYACVEMNDEKNMSFREIAKELRKNSKKYFKKSK